MKVIVCIMASDSPEYNAFKNEWIKNINYIKSKKNTFDFYFVYGGNVENVVNSDNYTDIYYKITETIPNMLRKTLQFFEYINESKIIFDFLLRTNLSTLFDFEKMKGWFSHTSVNYGFFGGSLIDGFDGSKTRISGTNMVFSKNVVDIIITHQDRFPYMYNEDVELSMMVFSNLNNCNHKTISRVDFLDNSIVFQKCPMFYNDVFCFRFKSSNRENDVFYYANVLQYIIINNNNLNTTFISDYINGKSVSESSANLLILSEKIWCIENGRACHRAD